MARTRSRRGKTFTPRGAHVVSRECVRPRPLELGGAKLSDYVFPSAGGKIRRQSLWRKDSLWTLDFGREAPVTNVLGVFLDT